MGGDIDRAHQVPARGIECVQSLSRGKPDMPTVERDPGHVVDARKGPILTEDFGS